MGTGRGGPGRSINEWGVDDPRESRAVISVMGLRWVVFGGGSEAGRGHLDTTVAKAVRSPLVVGLPEGYEIGVNKAARAGHPLY